MGAEVIVGLHLSEFLPLLVWGAAIFLTVQGIKSGARRGGIRHHRAVETMIPLMPVVIGAVTGGAIPSVVGLPAIVVGETVPWHIGAWYGAVVGGSSAGVYKLIVEVAPESWRPVLSQVSDGGDGE